MDRTFMDFLSPFVHVARTTALREVFAKLCECVSDKEARQASISSPRRISAIKLSIGSKPVLDLPVRSRMASNEG